MDKLTSIGDIVALDEMFREITAGLRYPSGSILKIAGRYLKNYGIEITADNREAIEAESLTNYFSCWGRSTDKTHDAIKAATLEAGFPVDNSDLNAHVGKMTVEVLRRKAKRDATREFNIIDVGAGTGETTLAVFDALADAHEFELAERCDFMALEPSEDTLWSAVNSLRKHRVKARITTIGGTNHSFLDRLKPGDADVIISSAVFHHMIFPSYLGTLREALADDGVLVIGDWYTSVFSHPAFIAEILRDLGIDRNKYMEFQLLFDCSDGDEKRLSKGMDRDEIITNYRMIRYIVAIGAKFLEIPPENRDEFLEGHCAFHERESDLNGAGFVTDHGTLIEGRHPGFTVLEEHEGPRFMDMRTNVRNVDPYGAAKVVAAAKKAFKPETAQPAGKKEKPKARLRKG